MLDVKTPLSKIHRPVRPVSSTYLGAIGTWSYIGANGFLTRIASDSTNQTQPKVLKLCFNASSSVVYESHDIKVGRISTLEGIFRAAVDAVGYQTSNTLGGAITYSPGDKLTPAYRITSTPTSDNQYCTTADVGKLRPAMIGNTIVALVENHDTANRVLTFRTVSPFPFGGDDVNLVQGSGNMMAQTHGISGS